jgi:hydroxymethylbilane synthase
MSSQTIQTLRLATRASPMALAQAHLVMQLIYEKFPACNIELVPMTTLGDDHLDKQILELDNKTVFVKTLENALLTHQADCAVHCVKDMSVYPVPSLGCAALLKRDDASDALLSCKGHTLESLPHGAVIGTGSPRRIAQLKVIRPDLKFTPIRGNVNSRIQKLEAGEVDALMLSYCGLLRINQTHYVTELFNPVDFISAVGQGALCVQCRKDDHATLQLLRHLNDPSTEKAIAAEQAFVHRLNGDCYTPMGVYAQITEDQLQLHAFLEDQKTGTLMRTKAQGSSENPEQIGLSAANDLIAKGAYHFVSRP